ncbi:hypothetical protein CRM22_008930 [Opisthorchis felineus]|uniref:Uncharacterized protein n=1 Tax=Opisthorchis felineus TaxID=147828 RepID=A0A4S2L8X9_OPIFE|nr:hypothetical protein CRM22_008930 [Opisthorchis felineus]
MKSYSSNEQQKIPHPKIRTQVDDQSLMDHSPSPVIFVSSCQTVYEDYCILC